MSKKRNSSPQMAWQLVNASCMDYVHMEMIRYIVDTARPEDVVTSIEGLGFQVGQRLVEKYTRDRVRFKGVLDIIKFICKDFWTALYSKQIDNLRTNHRGVYVLHDNKFRWLQQISPEISQSGGATVPPLATRYVVFPCGLIRGALAALGVQCTVTSEVPKLPSCMFTIKMAKA